MLAGHGCERVLDFSSDAGDKSWDLSPLPSPPPKTRRTKKIRQADDGTATERKRNKRRPAPPSLGRLKMNALLKREQEILKAKDESPYPTPVEEAAQNLLLKTFSRAQQANKPRQLATFDVQALIESLKKTANEKMTLNYFYLFLETDLEEKMKDEEWILDRYELALVNRPMGHECDYLDFSEISQEQFPRLREMCIRGINKTELMLVKINLDHTLLYPGDFSNISVFESPRALVVECTTVVYHMNQRILETKEVQYPRNEGSQKVEQPVPQHSYGLRSRGPSVIKDQKTKEKRHLYHFDFAKQFFSSFLAGFACLDGDGEKMCAVDNLSIMQVFEDVSNPFDRTPYPPLLCVCYQFKAGKGETEAYFIDGIPQA